IGRTIVNPKEGVAPAKIRCSECLGARIRLSNVVMESAYRNRRPPRCRKLPVSGLRQAFSATAKSLVSNCFVPVNKQAATKRSLSQQRQNFTLIWRTHQESCYERVPQSKDLSTIVGNEPRRLC